MSHSRAKVEASSASIAAIILRGLLQVRTWIGVFLLGATSSGLIFLSIENNAIESQRFSTSGAKPIQEAKASTDTEESKKNIESKEFSKEQLDRYVQWAQQMSARNQLGLASSSRNGGVTGQNGGYLPMNPGLPGMFGTVP